MIGKRIRAGIAGGWDVDERFVGIHRYRAVEWIEGLGPDIAAVQRRPVVARKTAGNGCIMRSGVGIPHGSRRIVNE